MVIEIKADTSNRHIHLAEEDFKTLFGDGAELTVKRMLGREEFAANETLTVEGSRGTMSGLRILGPYRKATQVELLAGDCRHLGIDAPVIESVADGGAAPIKLIGLAGTIERNAAMIAHRHVHLNEQVAHEQLGLSEGELVKVRVPGKRGLIFENVLVRLHKGPLCVVHLDAEEGNAAGLVSGQTVELIADKK